MSVRTYNPSVRVGNWNEDIQLEEDTLKDFLEKREKGELLSQKSQKLKGAVLQKVALSISRQGTVSFGDMVMLVNPVPKDRSHPEMAVSMFIDEYTHSSIAVASASHVKPCARTAFVITSCDGSPVGSGLKYGQHFYLCSSDEPKYYLSSDRATFMKSAKKSRHNEVTLVQVPSHLTEWKVLAFDPQYRLELEYTNVPANQNIILVHVKTNQALCVETNYKVGTPFGLENEMTTFTDLDSHKAEKPCNHFVIRMHVPGDSSMPVEAPESEAPPTIQQ